MKIQNAGNIFQKFIRILRTMRAVTCLIVLSLILGIVHSKDSDESKKTDVGDSLDDLDDSKNKDEDVGSPEDRDDRGMVADRVEGGSYRSRRLKKGRGYKTKDQKKNKKDEAEGSDDEDRTVEEDDLQIDGGSVDASNNRKREDGGVEEDEEEGNDDQGSGEEGDKPDEEVEFNEDDEDENEGYGRNPKYEPGLTSVEGDEMGSRDDDYYGDGKPKRPNTSNGQCDLDTDCPKMSICINRRCSAKKMGCETSNDCKGGARCTVRGDIKLCHRPGCNKASLVGQLRRVRNALDDGLVTVNGMLNELVPVIPMPRGGFSYASGLNRGSFRHKIKPLYGKRSPRPNNKRGPPRKNRFPKNRVAGARRRFD